MPRRPLVARSPSGATPARAPPAALRSSIIADADDRTLVAAAQGGDRDALDTLMRRHYDLVHAVCRRVLGTARDADDAAQEAMISIVRGLPRFDGRSAVTTWIYRIATNAALDEGRRRGRRPVLHAVAAGDDGAPEPIDPTAGGELEAVADRLAIDDALAELPEDFRVAVVLRDVVDLDYAEIATVLDLPVGTVKSRIARGRGQLVQRLGNNDPGRRRQNHDPSGHTAEPSP